MTVPELSFSSTPATEITADVLAFGVISTPDGPRLASEDPALEALAASLGDIGVTGAVDEVRRFSAVSSAHSSVLLVGLGTADATADTLRYAAGSATRQLRGVSSIAFALPTRSAAEAGAVLEGAAIGAYSYGDYREGKNDGTRAVVTTVIVHSSEGTDEAAHRADTVARAVHTVRDLVNAPPNDLYPATLAERAAELAALDGVEVEIFAEAELEAGGFGGILGVGQGSSRGPRLVKLSYSPAGAERHLALVGKGITFDSGGLSLKPPTSMIGMKYDMTGSATVLAVILAAARLQLPLRVTAWMCLAENMPSATATRPGDVIRIRGGKTVEVLNTDAEGRLVLADGLVAASEENPDAIIDVATLTGAAAVALGTRYVGTMGDSDLVDSVIASATSVGETLWPMPISPELRPLLASDIADIANIKPGNTAGGMLIAAAFLKDFVGSTGEGDDRRQIPWAHLDIAGPANNSGGGWGFTPKGPTGVTVRALVQFAEDFSRP